MGLLKLQPGPSPHLLLWAEEAPLEQGPEFAENKGRGWSEHRWFIMYKYMWIYIYIYISSGWWF